MSNVKICPFMSGNGQMVPCRKDCALSFEITSMNGKTDFICSLAHLDCLNSLHEELSLLSKCIG